MVVSVAKLSLKQRNNKLSRDRNVSPPLTGIRLHRAPRRKYLAADPSGARPPSFSSVKQLSQEA
jgi:hypothetical protein